VHGPDYVENRRRVGQAHAEVGLEPQWFLGAFNLYMQHCLQAGAAPAGQELSAFAATMSSLLKLILLDIGLALDAYYARSTAQLSKALHLYAQSNAALREFAHLTSHDLKTPLATVSSLCEEFLDEFGSTVPEEGRRLVKAARVRAMKMKGLIDELLAASEAAAQPAQRTRVSIHSLLDDVLARLRLERNETAVQLEVPDELPAVYAHPGRLREVFYHLLANAVKFMDKQPGSVRISAQQVGAETIFCVADNGPGIPEADQERIFVPFHRLPQHRHQPGTGLGLYFVRMIVEEQGGRVWVESTVGQGSRFYVALPR
jgi:signal transduction histidine kinase